MDTSMNNSDGKNQKYFWGYLGGFAGTDMRQLDVFNRRDKIAAVPSERGIRRLARAG